MGYKKWSVTEGDAPGFGGVEGIAPMVISSVASALGAVVGVKLLGGLSEHARDRRRSRPNTPRQSVGDAARNESAALPSKKPQIFKPRRRPRNAAHWSPDDSTTAVVTAAGATRPKVQLIANAATCAKVVDVALAAGAKPIMGATTPAEASETCDKVDATLLNFGTPTTEAIAAAAFDATSFSAVSDVVTPAASHSFISSFRSPYIRISAAISDAFPLTSVWIVFGLPFIL